MSVIIEIDDDVQAESIDLVMDFVSASLKQGIDKNDLIASMLCAVSAILEADATDKTQMQ